MILQQLQNTHALFGALNTFRTLYSRASHLPQLDGWSLNSRDPQAIEQFLPLLQWLYHNYYRVKTDGWEQVPSQEPVMLVGSHNGGLASPDMYMMMYDWFRCFGSERPLYGLMTPKIWDIVPTLAQLETQIGAVRAHPKVAIAALKQKASIAVYPGGIQDVFRPYSMRNKIYFHRRKGFIKLALREGVPIVPMISYGAHSTLRVIADIYPQMSYLHKWGLPWPMDVDPEVWPIYLGLPWGLAFGPLPNIPLPVRLHTRVGAPIRFERTGSKAVRDLAYVDACYDQVKSQMQSALDHLIAEQPS